VIDTADGGLPQPDQVRMMEKGEEVWDVVMLGSSPLESFRGTMLNDTFPGYDLIRNVFNMYFVDQHRSGVPYSIHILAVSGASRSISKF
jgi:hypothetical protein